MILPTAFEIMFINGVTTFPRFGTPAFAAFGRLGVDGPWSVALLAGGCGYV